MKQKSAILLAALVFLGAADARALIFGIRFSDISGQAMPAVSGADEKGRFGIYAGTKDKNNVFLIGADYDRFRLERGDSLLYSRRLTVNVGYRYQLFPIAKAEAMKVMPFVGLHYFKSFSKVSASPGVLSEADVNYYKDMSDDSGGWVALGVDYYLVPAFSLGGEAGIRYSTAKSKAYGYEIKKSEFHSYVALLVSFYLL